MGGVKRTLLCPGRKPFTGLFAVSHWGKRMKLATGESERLRARLFGSHCPFVVPPSTAQGNYGGLVCWRKWKNKTSM